jgi:error-prone DNA polymerase
MDDPLRPAAAVRLGLRYVRNLGDAEVTRVEVARQIGGPFADPADLAQRTGLAVDALEGLAASGALASLGLRAREGLWAAGALAGIGPDRLPLSPGTEPPADLPEMDEQEHHQASLWSTGISVRHPIEFIRDRLTEAGCLPVMEALELRRNGSRARVAGVVTHRQRPGTAQGVIFFNLEDETGLINVVVLPNIWAARKEVARRHPGLIIDGVLEYRDGVTNLVARHFTPIDTGPVKSRDFR